MPEFDKDQKPSKPENEYFARQEVEALRRLARKQAETLAASDQAKLKDLHHMKCPKCGFDLHTLRDGSLDIETCFNCHGVWLDAGELEEIKAQQKSGHHSVVDAVLNLFRHER